MVLAFTEMVEEALRSYFLTYANEPNLTNPDLFLEAISGLKAGKAPGPNSIPSRPLKYRAQRAVTFLATIFKVGLPTHDSPTVLASKSDIYARYMDDILSIYDSTLTSPTSIQNYTDTTRNSTKNMRPTKKSTSLTFQSPESSRPSS